MNDSTHPIRDTILDGVLLRFRDASAPDARDGWRLMTFDEQDWAIDQDTVDPVAWTRLLRRAVRVSAKVRGSAVVDVRSIDPLPAGSAGPGTDSDVGNAPADEPAEEVTMDWLTGVIDVATSDDFGEVESVLIQDEEWGDVLILHQGVGSELLDYVDERVRIRGTVFNLEDDDDFMHAVRVKEFDLDEDVDDDSDDDFRWLRTG